MTERTRRDLCPGLLRPWIADDGALVRVRVPGGIVPTAALCALVEVARAHGDGAVHLTSRANLQVRGLEHDGGRLPETVVADVIATGLVPSTSHELVRNILASPLTGRSGGRADLHPVVAGLDARLRAEPRLTALTGRFLFVLDDGRGDLVSRDLDLGLVALDSDTAQLRAGTSAWGPVIRLDEAAAALTGLAVRFAGLAGDRPDSPWHVDELSGAGAALLGTVLDRAERTRVSTPPPALGRIVQDDGRVTAHLAAPGGRVDAPLLEEIRALGADEIVVTPYRTLLVPDLENA
ncbi:sulfite reductase subunit beta [Micromonospora chalcea]|uniref:sulfite reductase subunit beta n=1 Tax=Micromonospora chalcea TaxID=1874 RepID=UPI0021A48C37|nr:sulfite reductase subunit beta [Micromonospora chalcea]MCT2278209.1 sulfite reductase subunit beta [Micromonospora chalcea]